MSEQAKARQEACCNASEAEYFGARPQIDTLMQRHNFCAGFYRGYVAALVAAPAQERIDALELEVRQLTEQAAALRHAIRFQQPAPSAAPSRVYLVATGEIHEGEETYTRHDNAPPPLCDSECLYTAPQAADSVLEDAARQPQLKVRLTAFPESNGKQNWTALLVRSEPWGGLVGNCGGISLARGELWNRVAYEAECARFLIGERDTEPCILDYAKDIKTPDEWAGEREGGRMPLRAARKQGGA